MTNNSTLEQFRERHPIVAQRAAELARAEHCLVTAIPGAGGVTLYLGVAQGAGAVVFTPTTASRSNV